MAIPHIILAGYGALDTLQLSVEAQRLLARYGSAYALGVPPNLAAYLKSQRVRVTDLADRFAPGRPVADAYLEVAHLVLERTAHERPVILLTPGNPLMFNAVGRYLAMEARRLELVLQAVPAVSPLDLIVSSIGLDVSTFGMQVFDASRLVSRGMVINPGVPAVLLHAEAFGHDNVPAGDAAPDLGELAAYLARCYPASHAVVVVRLAPGAANVGIARATLAQLPVLAGQLGPGSHLFLDLVRPQGTPTG